MFSSHITENKQPTIEMELKKEKIKKEKEKATKTKLITEELLYLNLLKNHRSIMLSFLFLHIMLMTILIIKIFFLNKTEENSFFCNHVQSIKNEIYLLMNFILTLYCVESIKKRKALISNIHYLEKTRIFLIFGMIISFSIFFFKFIPDFTCRNVSLNFYECFLMSFHIFSENFILFFYIKWFANHLKNFGMLIN